MDSPSSLSPPPDDESNNGFGSKRKFDDTEISNEVLVKTPHFITKTFQMINDSDRDIVEWTEAGDKFIVKDQERLSVECIPRYFNHNNFSSFTRQLNFYRFRKMFPSAFVKAGESSPNEKHLIFYHEKFNRDHPEWLPDIKRSTKTTRSSAEQEQIIDDLQGQVSSLEKRIRLLSSELHLKVTTMNAEFDRKLADLRATMSNEIYNGRATRLQMPPPSLPITQAPRPTTLNRYTTEDFIRSLVNGLEDGGEERERTRHVTAPALRSTQKNSLSSIQATTSAIPPPPRALNRLGTLTLDDINRIVTHLEGDGRVTDTHEEESVPGPTNHAGRISSLSAEEVLMTIRQMDSSRSTEKKKSMHL